MDLHNTETHLPLCFINKKMNYIFINNIHIFKKKMEKEKKEKKIKGLIQTRFDHIKDDLCYGLLKSEVDFLTTEFIAYNKKDFSEYEKYIHQTFTDMIYNYLLDKKLEITIQTTCIKRFTEEIDRYMKKFIDKNEEKTSFQKAKDVMDIFDYSFLHMIDKDTQLDRYTKIRLFKYIKHSYDAL